MLVSFASKIKTRGKANLCIYTEYNYVKNHAQILRRIKYYIRTRPRDTNDTLLKMLNIYWHHILSNARSLF